MEITTQLLGKVAQRALDVASTSLDAKYSGLHAVVLAYGPQWLREWIIDKRLTLAQIKAQEAEFAIVAEELGKQLQRCVIDLAQAEGGTQRPLAIVALEQAQRDSRLLSTLRLAMAHLPVADELNEPQSVEGEDVGPAWWETFESFARRANEDWRQEMLARALVVNERQPGAVRLKALWEIGMLEQDDFGALAIFFNACVLVDGLPIMLLDPAEQHQFVCELEGDVREANLAHVVADLVAAGLVIKSMTQIDASELVQLLHRDGPHLMRYIPPGAEAGSSVALQLTAYSPVDRVMDLVRLHDYSPDGASDANYKELVGTLTAQMDTDPDFGVVEFLDGVEFEPST